MNIRPLGERIFVKRIEQVKTSVGGILLIQDTSDKPMEGVVVAVGPGNYENGERVSLHIREGDRVVFGKWSGDDVEIDGEEFVILTEDNIIGVLK